MAAVDEENRVEDFQRVSLHTPPLEELVPVIQAGLSSNFENVTVEVVECPDLREFADLAYAGICGKTCLADIGGVPFMMLPEYHHITYDMTKIGQIACGVENPCILGAGAASPKVASKNAELMPNLMGDGSESQKTRCARLDPTDTNPEVIRYDSNECGCLANLFVSEGQPGPVLKIRAANRTGDLNFTHSIKNALGTIAVGPNQIGMGGVFKIVEGKIKSHIMPNFADCALSPANGDVEPWLRFFEVGPNLVCLATFVTGDPIGDDAMHLRTEHTHFYTLNEDGELKNEGGHYHYDVTPAEIVYEGYFSLAESIVRYHDAYPITEWNDEPINE